MRDSIDAAMDAARAFAARNPGQPLSVVFFNAKPTVALPPDDRARRGRAGAREAAEARRGDAHLRRARRGGRAGPRLGARRRAHRPALRRRRRRQHDEPRLGARPARGAEDPRVHRRHRVRRTSRPPISSRSRTRPAARTPPPPPPRRSRRSTTSSASGSATSTSSATGRTRSPATMSNVQVAVTGVEPVSFSYTTPTTGTAAPYKPAFRDKLLQSWLLLPLVVFVVLGLGALTVRQLLSLRSEQGARRAPRRVRHAPGRGAGEHAAQGGRRAPRERRAGAEDAGAASAGWRASPRTSTSRRSTATRARWSGHP